MKTFDYVPRGVCSRKIHVEMSDDGIVSSVYFTGGCMGNTQGVARLAEGRRAEDVIRALKGIDCGRKGTSCPDQLAVALERMLETL